MVLESWADGEGSLDKVPAAGSEPFPSQGNTAGMEDSRHRARVGGPLLWSVRKALLPGPRPSISQQWSWGLVRERSMETPMCSGTWII